MHNPETECKEMIERLKEICEQKHMTSYALANAAGISTSTLSYMLSGKTKPQVHTVLMLCYALGISITDLFASEDKEQEGSYEKQSAFLTEESVVRRYRQLSGRKKELLGIYLDMLEQYKENV